MMICCELDQALQNERHRLINKRIESITDDVIKNKDCIKKLYAEFRPEVKPKSDIDIIIDNVFASMREINPSIQYSTVKHRVNDYLSKNKKLIESEELL
jgi:predicted nucleotidyltransferase